MKRPVARVLILGALVTMTGLSACTTWSDSRVNPSNWFGRSRPAELNPDTIANEVNPLLPKSASDFITGNRVASEGFPIDQVTSLVIERTISGAIIRAEGLASRQGAYDARLIPDTPDETPVDGVLSYRFVVKYPNEPTTAGSANARTVSVARSVTTQLLEPARTIRVTGEQNARESRRR